MLPKSLTVLATVVGKHAVTAYGVPILAIPLLSQTITPPLAALNGAFPLLGTNSAAPVLRVPPAWSFSIGWLRDTFNSNSLYPDELFYWAAQVNTLPLPPWLQFDNTTLTFFGSTPNMSPWTANLSTETISITLYSGSVWGDNALAASADFALQVSNNKLVLSKPFPVIETLASSNVSFNLQESLLSVLECIRGCGGIGIRAEIDASGEDWLQRDSGLLLSGKVPDHDLKGRNISLPVTITDSFGPDLVQSSLIISILPYPFVAIRFPDITLSPGAPFNISIANYTTANTSFFNTYSIVAPSYDWLNIDDNPLQIEGMIPSEGLLENKIAIKVLASGPSHITASSTFFLITKAKSSDPSPKSGSLKSLVTLIVVIPTLICGCAAAFYWRCAWARRWLRTGTTRVEELRGGCSSSTDVEVGMALQSRLPILCPTTSSKTRVTSMEETPCIPHSGPQCSTSTRPTTVEPACAPTAYTYPSPVFQPSVFQRSFDVPETENERHLGDMSGMAQMPSINFAMVFSPHPDGATSQDWSGRGDSGPKVDQGLPSQDTWDTAQQIQRARSVNSAYDSLPSWDSESTWHIERRCRPPSPAWRRDDVDKGATLYDVLHKGAKALNGPGIEQAL